MSKKLLITILLISALSLSGCNFFGKKDQNGSDNGKDPEATPFQRDYEEDQKSDDGNYQIDLVNSNILWEARGANNARYTGTMKPKSATAGVEEGNLRTADVTVDLATLKADGGLTNIDTYIKGQSYFDVATNSEAKIKIISVEKITESPIDELNYEVEAEITVRGETQEVGFDAAIVETSDNVIKLAAEIDIDIADFGAPASTTTSLVGTRFEMNIEFNFKKA